MIPLTVTRRGFERSTLVQRGTVTVAEVFTDREPGDQYETAALFALAPELLSALRRVTHPMADDSDLNDALALLRRLEV